ncbi:MAG TPA: CRTAC1 family protein [Thermoanaerobaculia bacterium]|nr:CRTAC1 family protein [Thermoanaerobaculia bacterium]
MQVPARVRKLLVPSGLLLLLTAAAPPSPTEWFVDAAAESGLDFVHFNGMSGELHFAEMMGGGGALFDYDGDGDLDVFLVQGSMLGGKPVAAATFPPHGPLRHRLYRNDLTVGPDGRRTLRFIDVTEGSGIATAGYGNGVAAGDYDNDGRVDLYLLAIGGNRLLRNLGDGRFVDATREAGVEERRWSAAASFFDFDRDGWLDLYVGNYVDWNAALAKFCPDLTGARDYCGPLAYAPLSDRLFRNRGRDAAGRVGFEEVTARALPGAAPGTTLGSVAADYDGDGWQDLYVANDAEPNQLWLNRRDGTFADEALLAGCAVNEKGQPEASMGVDAGDPDNDGDEDLFMTHLNQETNTFYRNGGKGFFEDLSRESGLGPPSWLFTGFGTGFFDLDNDGWLDVVAANGAVKLADAPRRTGDRYPLHQTNQLFRNLSGDPAGPPPPGAPGLPRFEEVTARAGAVWRLSEVSRGIAFGDVDDDGDADLLVVNNSGPVRLLLNQIGSESPWVGLRLVGADGRRDQLGARVEVRRAKGPALWRRAHTDGSYLSASDPRVLVGLGQAPEVAAVRIHWPSGRVEEFPPPPLRAYTTLREGTGRQVPRP